MGMNGIMIRVFLGLFLCNIVVVLGSFHLHADRRATKMTILKVEITQIFIS